MIPPRASAFLHRRRRVSLAGVEAGFSLIETIAALVIFSIITLGLIPLLTTSIRASNTARSDTVGKNVAVKAMERVRGLPFYISYASNTTKVDVLDLYYPDYAGTVKTNPADVYYSTTCPATPTNPACPVDIPSGFTVTFEARFVTPVTGGTQPTVGESVTSYTTVTPSTTYAWNSASTDNPPRQLLRMDVTVSWTQGKTRTYRLSSILSDRDFGGLKVKATGTVTYGLEIHADYDTRKNVQGTPVQSQLSMQGPNSQSEIEARRLSTARQVTSAGNVSLTRYTNTSTGTDLGTSPQDAANTPTLLAPPDPTFADTSQTQLTMQHPDFGAPGPYVAGYGPSIVTGVQASASSLSPSAAGNARLTGATTGTGPTGEYMWARDPQVQNADYNGFNMPTTVGGQPPSIASLVNAGGLPAPILSTPATTGEVAVAGSQATTLASSVHSQATAGFDRLLFEKTSFIPDPAPISGGGTLSGGQGAVVVIDDFQAAASCDSTTAGTGTATSAYKATLYYWSDNPTGSGSGNGQQDGSYVKITFNVNQASTGTDPLAAVEATNGGAGPLVYDASSSNNDIWMFPQGLRGKFFGTGGGSADYRDYAGYLLDWDSSPTTVAKTTATTDALGNAVTLSEANVDSAISITTADLDITKQVESHLTVSLGTLSCLAEDLR